MIKQQGFNFSIQGKSKSFLLYLSTAMFSSNFNSYLFLVQNYFYLLYNILKLGYHHKRERTVQFKRGRYFVEGIICRRALPLFPNGHT